jgi:hypothetical protein
LPPQFTPRLLWTILAISLLLTGGLAIDASPWLRGGWGWRWQYAVPAFPRFWPLLLLTSVYVVLVVLAERRFRQSPHSFANPVVALVGFGLATVLVQLAILHLTNPSPISELFRRTVSPNSGGFFNVTVEVEDIGDYLRKFPQLMPNWPAHPQRHPPGVPLIFLGWRKLLEYSPAIADKLARFVRPDQCNNYNLMFFNNPQLASAWAGMLLPGLAALLVWPVYELGKRVYGLRVGWWAAAWVPLLPALVVFVPQWNQFYPVLTTAAVLAFWEGIRGRRLALTFLAGVLMSVSTFLSFTNLIVFGPLGLLFLSQSYHRYRSEGGVDARHIVLDLGVFGLGAGILWLGYWLWTGVAPLDVWQAASAVHLELERPYWPWLVLHLQDFFSFGGWILAGLFLLGFFATCRRFREGLGDNLAFALGVSVILLDVSGLSRAEVSRVWLPYLPLMAVTAAAALDQIKKPGSAFGLVTAALALNLLAVGGFLRPIDPEMIDPPLIPPAEPASHAVPINARFGDLAYLEGYRLTQSINQDGQHALELVLNWRALARSDQVYYVFVHFFAPNGERVAQSDDIPAQQGYPTTCWRVGQRLGDSYLITLPPESPRGSYAMKVGLYLLDSGKRLTVYREGIAESDFVQVRNVLVIGQQGASE